MTKEPELEIVRISKRNKERAEGPEVYAVIFRRLHWDRAYKQTKSFFAHDELDAAMQFRKWMGGAGRESWL